MKNNCHICGRFSNINRKICVECFNKYSWDKRYGFYRLKPYKKISKLQRRCFLLIRRTFKCDTFQEVTFNWLPYKRYDIVVPNHKIIFEVHGEQHFKRKKLFHKTQKEFEDYKENDIYKAQKAKENKYSYATITYNEDLSESLIIDKYAIAKEF